MRRVVPLLLIAVAVALAFLIIRSGDRARRPAAEPHRIAAREPREPRPAEPPDLALAGQPEGRVATPPAELPADPTPPPAASEKPSDQFSVNGRVVDDLGAPVPRFTLECARPEAGDSELDLEVLERLLEERGHLELDARGLEELRGVGNDEIVKLEGSDGVFHIQRLAPGQWALSAHAGARRRSAPTILSVPGEAEEIVLVIPRSGTIAGFVVGREGAAVADARVFLHYPGEKGIRFHREEPEPRARTGGAGEFLVESVSPGSLEIMARHADYADSEWRTLVLAPGELVRGVEIELTAGGRIEGYVDASLGDVADRQVDLFSGRGGIGWRDTHTSATGHFVIEQVMPQAYVIELRPAGYGKPEEHLRVQNEPGIRKNISVKEGETTQVVFGETRRQIAIHGLVLAGGAPAPGLSVRPYSKENEDRGEKVETGPDGRFELTVFGAGDYRFHVEANYGSYASIPQSVPDRSDVEVLFELPGGSLSGHVRDANGRRLSHVGVTLVRYGCTRENFYRDCYRRLRTAADGSFEFRLLAPGTYVLRAPDGFQDDSPPPRVPHGRVVLIDLVVGADELPGIEARLPIECRISGVVVDALGNPVTDAWVGALDERLVPLAGDGWETRTDATGHFEIESVGPGTHSVRARSGESEVRTPPFEVEAGKTATVQLEIE